MRNCRGRENLSSLKSHHNLKAHISPHNASHASPWEDGSQLNDRFRRNDCFRVNEASGAEEGGPRERRRATSSKEREHLRNGGACARLRALLTLRAVIAAIIHENIARNCILTVQWLQYRYKTRRRSRHSDETKRVRPPGRCAASRCAVIGDVCHHARVNVDHVTRDRMKIKNAER